MKCPKMLFITLCSLSVGGAFAAGETGDTEMSSQFEDLDTNSDRVVSQQEAEQNEQLMNEWDQLDANQDGLLEEAEFARFEEMQEEEEQDPFSEDTEIGPEGMDF